MEALKNIILIKCLLVMIEGVDTVYTGRAKDERN